MLLSECLTAAARRSLTFGLAFLVLLPTMLRAGTAEPRLIRHGGAVPSEYIVGLPDGTPAASVNAIAGELARDYGLQVLRTYRAALQGFHCRASAREESH